MIRSEYHLRQLCHILSWKQVPCFGNNSFGKIVYPIRRFHRSREIYSAKYSAYARNVKAFLTSTSRMSSSHHGDHIGDKPPDVNQDGGPPGSIVTDKLNIDVTDKVTPVDLAGISIEQLQSEIQKRFSQTVQKRQERSKIDITLRHTDNIVLETSRALREYLLDGEDIRKITPLNRRSAYPEKQDTTVFLRKDVERIAIEKYGSLEKLQDVKKRRAIMGLDRHRLRKDSYWKRLTNEDKYAIHYDPTTPRTSPKRSKSEIRARRVVLSAITVNLFNAVLKFYAWICTNSHSMFSEFIHSVADTINQVIIYIGLHQSFKQPDLEHPYGFITIRHIASLISGVGIFCLGSGLSFYHGIQGLLHPHEVEPLYWAILVLIGSFVSESATLFLAMEQTYTMSRAQKMGIIEYIMRGQDPSTNVVLLEDLASVFGVVIALSCMGITYVTGNPLADSIGCLCVGGTLAAVASIIIYTNIVSLIGRSVPVNKKEEYMEELENDRMVRHLQDVKATDMGGGYVRFKAEVDFDGRELTRYYLEKHDVIKLLQEVQRFRTGEEMEEFLLKHGESVVDLLGHHVDRIEKELKRRHPELRHIDIEQL